MSGMVAALGALVVVLAVVDVVWTTLAAAGAGPLSRALGRAVWAATGHHPIAGPLTLVATAALWTGLFWLGWALVFMAEPGAVVSASTDLPATAWERVYFAGYTVITLGLGDFVPSTTGWRLATTVSAATGLIFITLGVTYYTSVLSAVVHRRRLASLVGALGESPAAIVANAWDGAGFNGLGSVLTTLADHLAQLDRQHQAYPVLHAFGEREPERAAPVQIARLAEALSLFGAVTGDNRPPPAPLHAAAGAMGALLDTLAASFVSPADNAPPPPDTAPLRSAGIPIAGALALDESRRRLLLGLVEGARHDWAHVTGPTA
ncbi:potassium channel family protein [Rubrivirga sp. IMCC45206]|uniref:potassium channel family protein n=1 Tax=Rubrivirga sp. IMCC45206 TaxID=3391614 RepID=UPI00398FE8F0